MTDLEKLAPNQLQRRYQRGKAVLDDDSLSPEQKMWVLRALEYIYQTWHNQTNAAHVPGDSDTARAASAVRNRRRTASFLP